MGSSTSTPSRNQQYYPPPSPTMPPTTKNGNPVGGSTSPLTGCCIAFSGNFPGHTQAALLDWAASLGAGTSKTITGAVTHLVTSQADFHKPSSKVVQAKERDIFIVSLDWFLLSAAHGQKFQESHHSLTANPKSSPSLDPPSVPPAPKKRQASDTPASEPKRSKLEATIGDTPTIGKSQVAKTWAVQVPVDEGCTLAGYGVHVDDDSVIWDATLK